MAEVRDWDTTAANNGGASASGYWQEGMNYSEVNNAARENLAQHARLYADRNGSLDSTGSANAYVLAANQTLSALQRGDVFRFEANFTNTGAATLNVDAIGAVSIVTRNGSALGGGEILSGGVYTVVYDGTNFQILDPSISKNLVAQEAQSATFDFDDSQGSVGTWVTVDTVTVNLPTDITNKAVLLRFSGSINLIDLGSGGASATSSLDGRFLYNDDTAVSEQIIYFTSIAGAVSVFALFHFTLEDLADTNAKLVAGSANAFDFQVKIAPSAWDTARVRGGRLTAEVVDI